MVETHQETAKTGVSSIMKSRQLFASGAALELAQHTHDRRTNTWPCEEGTL
jgi:hypothetical protein